MDSVGIGLFNECFPPILDGVSITVKNYAYWLNKKVAPTIVVTPNFPGYSDHEEFSVYRYFSAPLPMRSPYRIGLPMFDYSINNDLDHLPLKIVHSHSPFSAGSLALKIARKKRIPIIATFHSKFRDDFETIISNKYIVDRMIKNVIRFFESVDEVWIPQGKVEETIRKYGYKGKLEVVENGIDMELPADINNFRQESRRILNIPSNEFVFLYVGQHIWEKNLKFVLESLRSMKALKFQAYFVGDGYARHTMEQMTNEFGLTDKVKFLGVVSDREHLKRIYASADLFLFPSLYDNAPLVVREAASMQTPSLLLKGSTAAEVITHGVNGYLSDHNSEAFLQKIYEVYCNPEALRQVGLAASLTLCRSWENIADEVKDRYENLMKRKNIQAFQPRPQLIRS